MTDSTTRVTRVKHKNIHHNPKVKMSKELRYKWTEQEHTARTSASSTQLKRCFQASHFHKTPAEWHALNTPVRGVSLSTATGIKSANYGVHFTISPSEYTSAYRGIKTKYFSVNITSKLLDQHSTFTYLIFCKSNYLY